MQCTAANAVEFGYEPQIEVIRYPYEVNFEKSIEDFQFSFKATN